MRAEGVARRFSIEATRPKPAEIDAVADGLGAGHRLYLSAVPTQSYEEHAATAAYARRAGFEPVVHVTARRLASAAELGDVLSRLRGEADVRTVLVLAGDTEQRGPYKDALALIHDGALQRAGITEIGISGYPEGHSVIPAEAIERALHDKIAAAREAGLRLHIVSQFSFDPQAIVAWLRRLRADGIAMPIHVGMAGPTGIPALLRYARRCGVNASMRGLMSGAAASLLGNVGPDRIIDALDAISDLGDTRAHYFSFGGLAETARYALAKSKEAASAAVVAAS
jgi:methylenetetrahydrofolate reductase (NADPH)